MPRSTPSQHLIDLAKHFHLITAAKQQPNYPIPARIEAIGFQERAAYEALVASSRVMLGIGHPPISPSVYTSLLVSSLVGLACARRLDRRKLT